MQGKTQELFTEFVKSIKSKELSGKELYEQYASYKQAIKMLSEYVDELNGLIMEEMLTLGVEKQEFEFGKFTRGTRSTWEYNSPELYAKEKEIKKLKEELEESGIATKVEKSYLLYK
jgi:hypothetical protein